MSQVSVKNLSGEIVKEIELPKALFDLPSNDALLHQVYVTLTANLRQPIAHTKDRAERSGSGIKPWRQKGTGRARVGSVRSPLWRKGGVTFGPTKDRNFSRKVSQKMRQKAVLVGLSEKLRCQKMVVVEELKFSEAKTKQVAAALEALHLRSKSVALCFATDERAGMRLSRNIPKVENIALDTLSIVPLLNREYLLLSEAGLQRLIERFQRWNKAEAVNEEKA